MRETHALQEKKPWNDSLRLCIGNGQVDSGVLGHRIEMTQAMASMKPSRRQAQVHFDSHSYIYIDIYTHFF